MSDRLKRLRKGATRPRRTVPIVLDGEVREQIEAVEGELDRLGSSPEDNDRRLGTKAKADGRRAELEGELERLYESAGNDTLYLVVEGLQRTPYLALLGQYPPRTDDDGKVLASDRLINANLAALAVPLAKACIVGHREQPEADAKVLPLDGSTIGPDGKIVPGTVDWLLGYTDTDETVVDGFAVERQVDMLAGAALSLCSGRDAGPLQRRRSRTTRSAGE